MINGEYCTLAAEIDAALNTTHHLKLGETRGYLIDRANALENGLGTFQAGGEKPASPASERFTQSRLKCLARRGCPIARLDILKCLDFASAREAPPVRGASHPRFSGDEFWVHPKAVARSWYRRLRAA